MFWLRNKKYNFQLRTLIWGPWGFVINYCDVVVVILSGLAIILLRKRELVASLMLYSCCRVTQCSVSLPGGVMG